MKGWTVFNDLGSHRSRLDIIAAILTLTKKKGIGITNIMYGANINFKQLKQYMEFLVEKKLLRVSETDSKKRYKTTSRGIELLKDYEKIQKSLKHWAS